MSMMKRFPGYPKRPHASGQARIKLDGRDHYLGVWGSPESKLEHARLAQEWAASGGLPPPKPSGQTVGEISLRFQVSQKAAKSAKEMAHYRRTLAVLVEVTGDAFPAGAFDVRKLTQVRTALVAGSLDRSGWSRSMVNAAMVRIRHVWRWAEAEGLVPRGSWEHLRTLRPIPKTDRAVRQTKPREGVDWPEVEAILPHLPAAVAAMAQVQWWTGMRPSEVVRMRADDIETDGDGILIFWLAGGKNSWRPGREREGVVIGPEARKVMEPWLVAARQTERGYLWPTGRPTQGRHYTPEAYARALSRAFDGQPRLKRWTPYQLRHGAKRRIKRAFGLDAARAVLRQSSIQTTDRYDAARDMEAAKDVARKTG